MGTARQQRTPGIAHTSTADTDSGTAPKGVDGQSELGNDRWRIEQLVTQIRAGRSDLGISAAAPSGDVVMTAIDDERFEPFSGPPVDCSGIRETFLAYLEAQVGSNATLNDGLYQWSKHLSHGSQVRLFEWIGIPLATRTGAPAKRSADNGLEVDNGSDILSEAELPQVLSALFKLPREHWKDPAAQDTYTDMRPGQQAAYEAKAITLPSLEDISEDKGEFYGDLEALFHENVTHEIGHVVDNAMPDAHTSLMDALGYRSFEDAGSFLAASGLLAGTPDQDRAHALVEAWMHELEHDESLEYVRGLYLDLEDATEAEWAALKDHPLVEVLEKSASLTRLDKAKAGQDGAQLYQMAGQYQLWGAPISQHITSWANGRAAFSDKEYVAELYRCYFTASSAAERQTVLGSYPQAAQDWIRRAEAFGQQ